MAGSNKQEKFIRASQNRRLKAFNSQKGNYMGGSFQNYELIKRADKLMKRKIEKKRPQNCADQKKKLESDSKRRSSKNCFFI